MSYISFPNIKLDVNLFKSSSSPSLLKSFKNLFGFNKPDVAPASFAFLTEPYFLISSI